MTDKPRLTVVPNTGTKAPAKQTRKKSGSIIGQKGMTDKQQAFVDAVFAGSNFSDAYRTAYDAQNMSAGAIHREACLLAQHPKVSQRLEQMWADREREQRMQRLSRAERVVEKLEASHCVMVIPTAHKCGHWNFWARRWGCSLIALRLRTRRRVTLMRCGLNWKHG
jgi:hypothetical protein